MTKFNTRNMLQKMEHDINLHISIAKDFRQMPVSYLILPPGIGKWNVVQCFQHLNTYGDYYLPLLEALLKNMDGANDVFKSSTLGNYFVRMMESKTFFKKFKAAKIHFPVGRPDAKAVLDIYILQKQRLLQLLKHTGNIDLNKGRIPLSINRFIELSPGDALRFMVAHDERHILQAKKALFHANTTLNDFLTN